MKNHHSLNQKIIAGVMVNMALVFLLEGFEEVGGSFYFFIILLLSGAVGLLCLKKLYSFQEDSTLDIKITLTVVGALYMWQVVPEAWGASKEILIFLNLLCMGALTSVIKKWDHGE